MRIVLYSNLLCCQCHLYVSFSTHQPGVWQASLGTGVNELCLRESQNQTYVNPEFSPTCHYWCFTALMFLPKKWREIQVSLLFSNL